MARSSGLWNYFSLVEILSLVETFWFFLVSGEQLDNTWISYFQHKIIVRLQEEDSIQPFIRSPGVFVLQTCQFENIDLYFQVQLQAWIGEFNFFDDADLGHHDRKIRNQIHISKDIPETTTESTSTPNRPSKIVASYRFPLFYIARVVNPRVHWKYVLNRELQIPPDLIMRNFLLKSSNMYIVRSR